MNSHIAITAEGKPLNLPEDFSIDIDDQNPLFNDNEMFSYPVQMPMEGNRFLLGNIDDPMNVDRPVGLEHKKMRIIVDNQPFRSGTLVTSEDEEIDGALTMNISASEHSIDDLIGTLSCRDVPLKDEIQIGEKIGAVTARVTYKHHIKVTWEGKKGDTDVYPDAQTSGDVVFTPQALGFSCPYECQTTGSKEKAQFDSYAEYANGIRVVKPKKSKTKNFINVSAMYGETDAAGRSATYCNARVAYKHMCIDKDDDKKTGDPDKDASLKWGPEHIYPYWVLDAERQQSGICFYVMYFLECLFNYVGVSYDQSELMRVDDMRRLCFFTTHCKYEERKKYPNIESFFTTIDQVNEWLDSRGCGGRFEYKTGENCYVNEADYYATNGEHVQAVVGKNGVQSILCEVVGTPTYSCVANIMRMYATNENFPDESVSTVLDSLYNSFGIKFEYNYEKKHVRAYFVRDVFRSNEAPIDFPGKVISMHKVAEKITGVRMCYGNESSSKEQKNNLRTGKRDYDTDYDYIDYPQQSTITNQVYKDIFRLPQRQDAKGNMNVYIDKKTGNAYRIKINGDADKGTDMHPSLFEVGAYKGVELGDCSELNEDFVQEFKSDFVPMIFNDVNMYNETAAASGQYTYTGPDVRDSNNNVILRSGSRVELNKNGTQPILAAYVDEDMEHEFLEKRIHQVLASNVTEFYIDEVLRLKENYDPSSTEDGNSPLQNVDWGLSIAIMRGGGSDMTYETYDKNYDGFGNSKWRTIAGTYALTSDSIDMFGNVYDYNGTKEGIGDGERFSLKIRAWKQPEWANAPLIDPDIVDNDGNIETKIMSRGLFDTFMSEMANFVLKRRKYRIKIDCSAAQVADVPNNWTRRYRINGLVGFINKLSYSLTVKEGLKDLEVEFYVV